MKTRNGFISNSSSNSFIIKKASLTYSQVDEILNHRNKAGDEAWIITEDYARIYGSTDINNFDMECFLDEIGVAKNSIEWKD